MKKKTHTKIALVYGFNGFTYIDDGIEEVTQSFETIDESSTYTDELVAIVAVLLSLRNIVDDRLWLENIFQKRTYRVGFLLFEESLITFIF